MSEFKERIEEVLEPIKPKDCFECVFFGAVNLLLGISSFPSLCQKDLLWFNCKGEKGVKKEDPDDC